MHAKYLTGNFFTLAFVHVIATLHTNVGQPCRFNIQYCVSPSSILRPSSVIPVDVHTKFWTQFTSLHFVLNILSILLSLARLSSSRHEDRTRWISDQLHSRGLYISQGNGARNNWHSAWSLLNAPTDISGVATGAAGRLWTATPVMTLSPEVSARSYLFRIRSRSVNSHACNDAQSWSISTIFPIPH